MRYVEEEPEKWTTPEVSDNGRFVSRGRYGPYRKRLQNCSTLDRV